jgi:2-(1,2-epoxy-1,2-dihydrophenyl)acetyl-CoA isomerase
MTEAAADTTVLANRIGDVAVITLNRPGRMNAFIPEMHAALAQVLDEAGSDASCRAIVLTGAGRGFCAGQDLNARKWADDGSPPDLGESLDMHYNPLVRRIRTIDKPVICAVNGVAAGAGANIALACDIVIASREASFVQAFCKIGLIPDSGGTWILSRLVGEARAKALTMTGTPVPAEQAVEWGMIWKAVDAADLMDEALALAAGLAAAPTFGLGLTKRAIHEAARNTLDTQLNLERDLQRRAGRSPDYREGVMAFREKRLPRFTGRGDE